MNRRLVIGMLGTLTLVEAACMLPSLILALVHRQGDARAFIITLCVMLPVGLACRLFSKPGKAQLRACDGVAIVSLGWVAMSFFGAMPFVINGMIPNWIDALFEAISGFTTTGATILTAFDGLPKGLMFWRAFTHWIGGMGVLVLTMAILPKLTGGTAHLMRAESPGPTMSKLLPKMRDTAKTLYMIYLGMTVVEFILLIMAGLNIYDAAIHAMSTAGTGGFSNYGASVGAFNSPVVDAIITVFMFAFGVNFTLWFHLCFGNWKELFRSEEFRWYAAIYGLSVVFVTSLLVPRYGSVLTSLRYSTFQIASFMSTTGFTTADYNSWPEAIRMLLIILMFIGSCAGSTAGGLKVVRFSIMMKQGGREIGRTLHPRKTNVVIFERQTVQEEMLQRIAAFTFLYVITILAGAFLISLDGCYTFETNFSSALSCVSNIGPVLGGMDNMAGYSAFSKGVMCLLMLAGRLELLPMLALFNGDLYKKI